MRVCVAVFLLIAQASPQEKTGENVGCPIAPIAAEGEVSSAVNLLQTSYAVKHSNDSHGGHQSTYKAEGNRTEQKRAKDGHQEVPCQCDLADSNHKPSSRTVPRCVFIDLGAADGNTFNGNQSFLTGTYGDIGGCPSSQWHAVLVEANPHFDQQLQELGAKYAGDVTILSSTAAYMCDGTTSFYLDDDPKHNYWGSSMTSRKMNKKKAEKVTVPTSNLNRILLEHTISEDWVVVKMDIEGAEYDILPCLADSPSASLIDTLYLEDHASINNTGSLGTTIKQFRAAKRKLKAAGAAMPSYFSRTL